MKVTVRLDEWEFYKAVQEAIRSSIKIELPEWNLEERDIRIEYDTIAKLDQQVQEMEERKVDERRRKRAEV